ncbi:MAG: M23 family metallopeptidase [Candidatus Devosia euplotis]|nr:M23 family metallopeptidase [Candidatus Devosia euplotis]
MDLSALDDGMGGPLLPSIDGGDRSSVADDSNAVMEALVRYQAARDSIEGAPVHMPITGNFRRSSGFGNRTDPFTGGRAFHSGLDFAAAPGTTVLSAGKGVATFVGTRSGHGKTVEVTHDDGLITHYGHLSGYLSQEGQRVNIGIPIAKIGSTGRSTSPHCTLKCARVTTPSIPRPSECGPPAAGHDELTANHRSQHRRPRRRAGPAPLP